MWVRRREVVDDVGPGSSDGVADGRGIDHVDRGAVVLERHDRVARLGEVGDEVPADEAECAGDERSHRATRW